MRFEEMIELVTVRDAQGRTVSYPKYLTKHIKPDYFEQLKNGQIRVNTIRNFNSAEHNNPNALMSDETEARYDMNVRIEDLAQKLDLPFFKADAEDISGLHLKAVRARGVNDWAYCLSKGSYNADRHKKLLFGDLDREYPGTPDITHYVVFETLPLMGGIQTAARGHKEFSVKLGGSVLFPREVTYSDIQELDVVIKDGHHPKDYLLDTYWRATSFKPKKFEVEEEFRLIMCFKETEMADWDAQPIDLEHDLIRESVRGWGTYQ